MGDHVGWAQPSGLLPNGLLPNEAVSVTRVLDPERWLKAEERTAELIACIQPNKSSEERRNAVADYVKRLIMKCFSCQVFTFGSVPLKTYLPDGDIDLTTFSKNQNLKDTWANKVRDMLENEEKSENAEFHVKEVQYIQAEVKIIKCLVENIVVDISFNQLGGLCTLCFLEKVDHLISQNHLFKRSIILIKAWCYYESRILGAHHGLISTYALETLVLYIFHVFNNSFTGPLEVLYRFLEFFSNFDWENFCVSLWGPVPITSLPDLTAESPRKDSGELLLNKLFLDACSLEYAVFPGGQENQGQPFISKHFNIIDPLRTNNNLGRSVSKGNFFRIRSAFAFGAKRLARLLDCPKENLIVEVNQFFMNTWERHGSGCCPDAPSADLWHLQSLNSDHVHGYENFKNYSSSKKKNENSAGLESEAVGTHTSHGISSQDGNHPLESMSRTSNTFVTSRTRSQRYYANVTSSRVSDQVSQHIIPSKSVHTDKGWGSCRADYLMTEVQGRYQFARTRSSPELTETSGEVVSPGGHNRVREMGQNHITSSRPDYSRREKLGSEVSGTHSARSSTDDPSSMRRGLSHPSPDSAAESDIASNNHPDEAGLGAMRDELASFAESMDMHQEEQDLVNMMASSGLHGFGGLFQMPKNLGSPHLPLPTSPSVLASINYSQKNLAGMVPSNIPLIEPLWGSNMQFPQGLVSSPLSHYIPGVQLASSSEEMIESSNEKSGLTEVNQEEGEVGLWQGQDAGSSRGFDPNNGGFQMLQSDDKQQSTSLGFNFVPLSWMSSAGNSVVRDQHRLGKENRGLVSEDHSDTFQFQNNREDEVSKSAMDKWGRRTAPSTMHGKDKSGWQYDGASDDHGSSQADDDNRDWIPLSTMGPEIGERSTRSTSIASSHTQSYQIPSYELTQMTGPDSMIPVAPMLVGSASRQRMMDNSGVLPFAFYLTGPTFPFLAMLPVCNFPSGTGNSEGSSSHFDGEEVLDNGHINHSDQNFNSAESLDQSEIFSSSNPTKRDTSVEPCEEHKSDILYSDFTNHWQNLQYGRFCQNPWSHGPLIYRSPVMVPPVYLQGNFAWDGPGRPLSANMNPFTQITNCGSRLIPIAPLQPGSNRSTGVFQRYGNDRPRYRGGTGTYLPNPKVSFREPQSSNARNYKGNYNNRNDHHGDREGNWNSNSRRASVRKHSRCQAGKPSSRLVQLAPTDGRADSSRDSHRNDSFPSYQGPFVSSNSRHGGSSNMAYGMCPQPAVNSNIVASTGPSVPSVVMSYPYDRNVGYGSPSEQLGFGSPGQGHFPAMSEVSQLSEGGQAWGVHEQQQRFQGGSPAYSSPDQPSSPQPQRGI